MKSFLLTFAIVVMLAPISYATSNPQLREYILKGLEYSYEEEYDLAEHHFREAIEKDPNDPSGYFFLCGMYGLYMNDFSTEDVLGLFLINLFETINTARERIESDSTDGWAHFYLGGAHAYRAFREQQKGSKWTALGHALTAVSELKSSVEHDTTIYDAYMGIGSYHYFINHLWSYIPFLGRNPDKGIEEIRLAAEKATFVRTPAREGLVYILLREKRFGEAIGVAQELTHEYPASRTFQWTLGKAYEDAEDWENASDTYRELFSMIEEGQPGHYYNLAFCGRKLAYCLYRMGENDEASRICVEMMELIENPYDHPDMDSLRGSLKDLLLKIRKARRRE